MCGVLVVSGAARRVADQPQSAVTSLSVCVVAVAVVSAGLLTLGTVAPEETRAATPAVNDRLVLDSVGKDNWGTIFTVNVDGLDRRGVSGAGDSPALSLDGRRIAYEGVNDRGIRVVSKRH